MSRLAGPLNGVTAATTPYGTRVVKPKRPAPVAVTSSGSTSPMRCGSCAAQARMNVPTRLASKVAASRGQQPLDALGGGGILMLEKGRMGMFDRGIDYLGVGLDHV